MADPTQAYQDFASGTHGITYLGEVTHEGRLTWKWGCIGKTFHEQVDFANDSVAQGYISGVGDPDGDDQACWFFPDRHQETGVLYLAFDAS
jgi:hypothetical protein